MTWPTGLPTKPVYTGYSERWGDGTIRTQTDTGPAKVRLRYTAVPEFLTVRYILNSTQVETLRTFYVSSAKMGAVEFEYIHPRSNATRYARFAGEPIVEAVGKDMYSVTLRLEILP